jgi:hypothetical protein
VLFVFDGQILVGVIHLSDLYRNVFTNALQHDFLAYERNLRQYYLLYGVNNEHIIDYFKYKAIKGVAHFDERYKTYTSKIRNDELKKYGELQHFYLSDLLMFGNSSFSQRIFKTNGFDELLKQDHLNVIISFRNNAMHAKDSIDTKLDLKVSSEHSIIEFFHKIKIFIKSYEELDFLLHSNKRYVEATALSNAGKLQIIWEHFPNAIEYFIK